LIDLHLHLLYATDDGALDLAQAAAMARLAAADGCTALVATPHQRRDEWRTANVALLRDRLERVRESVDGALDLRLGAEVRVDSELLTDLARPERAGILTLAGSRHILLELEPMGLGPDPVELAIELVANGFSPIFAHPELVPFLWEPGTAWFPRLAESGATFQVTAMSLTGEFGRGPKECGWQLVEEGFAQFVASDAHRPDWRPPGLARAYALLADRLGEPIARRLTVENPRCVLDDRPLPRSGSAAAREAVR
jgi:protein-tyrosine phosphatase